MLLENIIMAVINIVLGGKGGIKSNKCFARTILSLIVVLRLYWSKIIIPDDIIDLPLLEGFSSPLHGQHGHLCSGKQNTTSFISPSLS